MISLKKVVVLFGGNSFEHEVSINSAKSILKNIDKSKYEAISVGINKDNTWYLYNDDIEKLDNWLNNKIKKIDNIPKFLSSIDVVFNIIHGNTSEDGILQGLFQLFNIKYVGCDLLTNAVCYDKEYTKIILEKYHIPTAPYYILHNKKELTTTTIPDTNYPLIIKPCTSGSSIGINVANNKKELNKYVTEAFKYSQKVLVEKFIKARELECAILNINNKLHISTIGEITYDSLFYDYDAKYVNDSKLIIPSTINEEVSNQIKEYVKTVVKALNIKGLSRIDFLYEEQTNNIYLIEVNTLPGFTNISMYPKLLEYDKIKYSKIITLLIEDALKY